MKYYTNDGNGRDTFISFNSGGNHVITLFKNLYSIKDDEEAFKDSLRNYKEIFNFNK